MFKCGIQYIKASIKWLLILHVKQSFLFYYQNRIKKKILSIFISKSHVAK